jgi:hypothetical protein
MFCCAICKKNYDDSLKNEHHRIPQAFGGDDSPSNIRFLCAGCHQTLHRLAEHFANTKKIGRTKDIATAYCMANCENPQIAIPTILDLARCACEYELKVNKGTLQLSPWSEKVVSIVIPLQFKKAFELACKRKNVFGRKGSMTSVVENFILNIVASEFPNMRNSVMQYISMKMKK